MVIKKNCKDRGGCHNTGKYRGGAHSICNLKYSAPKKIPVVFYSGSLYHDRASKRVWRRI